MAHRGGRFLEVAGVAVRPAADGKALLPLLPAAAPSPVLPSWDPTAATPCSWVGVTCSPQSRVSLSWLPPQLRNLDRFDSNIKQMADNGRL
uniref:Leucine-rich repeat-containing N-terminal plant-type domain-containing protein n=2 Tax=Oryza TaxID=4527 RepID=A0A0E0QN58_ORYRU